jgi:hypothetical protein
MKIQRTPLTNIAAIFLMTLMASSLFGQESAPIKAEVTPGDINLGLSRVYTFVDKKGVGHQHAIEGKLSSGSLMM